MRRPCIIIDIDNTLVDTAIRKRQILNDTFSINVSLEQIRDDFELKSIIGEQTEVRKKFFSLFESVNGIKKFNAPLFANAKETIENLSNEGISIIFLTARPDELRDVTIEELKKQGIDTNSSPIYFKTNDFRKDSHLDFKTKIIHSLGANYFIITTIGDRLDDVYASANNHIPSILITSTTKPSEIINANIVSPAGFQSCSDWTEIEKTIKVFISGNKEIQEFRKQMIDLYSKWLGEIDNKLRVSVSIASILCALSGKIILDMSEKGASGLIEHILLYVMLSIFLLALISLIFAIRSITSRSTSGEKSGKAVKVKIKQGLNILFGRHEFESIEGDAIADFEKFKGFDTIQKASAHRTFFYKQYSTYDPDALWNFRFFSIRAANYSKLYGERLASNLLIIAIMLLGLWLSMTIFLNNKGNQNLGKQPIKNEVSR